MKKRLPTLLASLIGSALYSQQALADLADQCLLGVPAYTKPLVNGDPNALPVYIQADKAAANYPEHALFSGNVDIEQGNSTLTADEVQLTQRQEQNQAPLRTVTATGNVNYASNEIKLQGPKAWSNLNTKDTDVYQGNYQMVGRQGRGDADTMKQRGDNRYTVLENGSFTSCLPGDDSWSVVGSEVIHDREEQVAEIWNARFKIGKVPVFYSPYLQMPVGDKRRSGFLIPNAKYGSNNGFEFSAPYYLNLAPNYDATITPNYMSKRGTQIQTEFRYLTTPGEGLVEFDWLPKDRVYSSEHASDGDSDRWLLYWHHNGVMDQVWRFNVDYTKVSDSNYFDDLDSKYGSTTDGYATQKFSFGYADENWDSALSYKQFQVFDTNSSDAYRAAPQFDLTYYKNDIGPFDLKVFSQTAKFTNVNNDYPEATRLHIEPTLNLPLANLWGSLNTEVKLIATHYQQENIDYYNENTTTGRHLKGSVNRVMPQFKTDGKMVFERDMDYAPDYTQTLEPRLQYLYVPYRNQNDIGVYDSTILQTDYSGLFRDRTYSGLDRISSANQLAGGVTTRIYDDQRVERFNASVGQIYYFSWPRTGDITGTWDNYDNTGSVVWAGDSYWRISNQWGVRGGLQYDSRLNSVALGDAVLEYRRDENRILQLNYRYASPQYIEQMLSDISHPGYQQGISQVGVTGSWPLVDHWSLVGAYYYDTKANQPADQLVGLQYNTCCWAINVGYERKIIGWNNTDSSSQYDNKVSFNIELRDLSSNYGLGTDKMLGSGILPYQRAF
ncbi:Outer membrane protein required for envelope biogenesis / Organic solvent tolerance protein precursor [Candidatus Sodalis pierantonius str. SOPE]|uniref:LPS-assembly protein LptD n=1 Tax=Candidatus Sodalis pierantonii str. SOPE TaxID=2342 RepID=W0HN58_9GAMM|nr:LPS assembly protein LptD [Candidatus Sodalis pierantonius]AHF73630.1 Outer membrane protein required for envelope biogenesis / Organic solvent tolerance protein precursor [Candidatus Sodalis pierantonius str. SOPE]